MYKRKGNWLFTGGKNKKGWAFTVTLQEVMLDPRLKKYYFMICFYRWYFEISYSNKRSNHAERKEDQGEATVLRKSSQHVPKSRGKRR